MDTCETGVLNWISNGDTDHDGMVVMMILTKTLMMIMTVLLIIWTHGNGRFELDF